MQASKSKSATTWRHFSDPPAMPMARHPLTFAIWPTALPTAPAAAETTTVSPALMPAMSTRPTLAVEDDMLTPAELALHGVADPVVWMAGLDDHAGTAPDHHVADFDGIGVLA